MNDDLHIIDYVNEDYKGLGVAATYSAKNIKSVSGRQMGVLLVYVKLIRYLK